MFRSLMVPRSTLFKSGERCGTPGCFSTALAGALLLTACAPSHSDEDNAPDAGTSQLDAEESLGEENYCTFAGCFSNLTIFAPLPASLEAIYALSLEVCRNGACHSIELAALRDSPLGGMNAAVSYGGMAAGFNAFVFLMLSRESERYALEAMWQLPRPGDLRDGDQFRVTLSDPTGRPWRVLEQSVTYTWTYPNGENCPPGCQRAEIRAPE
jgi:hypothetical protein